MGYDGWPDRPVRVVGSRSDKKPRHADTIVKCCHGATDLACGSTFSVDQARRGFLSMRDPAGAGHTAGPPDSSLRDEKSECPR